MRAAERGRIGSRRGPPAFAPVILLARFVFKRSRQFKRVKKWDDAKHAERAVDQAPSKRYLANGSANERQWDHQHTSNNTCLQNPNVAHRVNKYADEENSNDNMCERQPIGAVSQPGIFGVALPQAVSNSEEPA